MNWNLFLYCSIKHDKHVDTEWLKDSNVIKIKHMINNICSYHGNYEFNEINVYSACWRMSTMGIKMEKYKKNPVFPIKINM